MGGRITYREGLTAGAFGAAALLLPFVFHVLQLGHVFMPMYIPLVALAFYASPAVAVTTALLVPLLSSVFTGMPPTYPPIAPIMAVELAFMAGAIALARRRWPAVPVIALLAPALLAGRALHVGLVYLASMAMELPAGFLAGVSLLTGWPGVLLMLVVIPALLRTRPPRHTAAGGVSPSAGVTRPASTPAVTEHAKREYFDAIAARWEGMVDSGRTRTRLSHELDKVAIRESEHVLDLGCGTGILTSLLLPRLSAGGKVSAVDFSGSMLEQAGEKIHDRRVSWIAADAASMPLARASVDRAIAFSTWPHFPDPDAVLRELRRVIRPGGALHVIHVDSRASINAIHTHAGGPIGRDRLVPAPALASAMERCGFIPASLVDDGERYVVSAHRDFAP